MKKQLLIALLAFSPFFTDAKPSNAKLLKHLKNVKADIKNMLQEISKSEKEVRAKLNLQTYKELTNQWNVYLDAIKKIEKTKLDLCFNLICTNMNLIEAERSATIAFNAAAA